MELKDWLSIGIALVGLIGGSGWVKYYLEQRERRKSQTALVLKAFLYKLRSILNQNKRMQEALKRDSQFDSLEYAPDYLQEKFFGALPETDSRKVAWKTIIESLIEQNEEAVRLLHEYAGEIARPEFRAACDEFIDHATEWSAVWKATIGDRAVPMEMHVAGKLMAPAFPESMETELEREIALKESELGI